MSARKHSRSGQVGCRFFFLSGEGKGGGNYGWGNAPQHLWLKVVHLRVRLILKCTSPIVARMVRFCKVCGDTCFRGVGCSRVGSDGLLSCSRDLENHRKKTGRPVAHAGVAPNRAGRHAQVPTRRAARLRAGAYETSSEAGETRSEVARRRLRDEQRAEVHLRVVCLLARLVAL